MKSTVTLEPRTSTQCWPYYFGPEQGSGRENHTYCTPTLGRLKKRNYNRLRTLRIGKIVYNTNHFAKHIFKS